MLQRPVPTDTNSAASPTGDLLRRARAGEAAAVAALHARFTPRVRGLAVLRLGESLHDFVDCDDIVQEVMTVGLTRLDQFTGQTEAAFVCWLAAIVESRVQTARRAGRAQKRGGGRVVRRADLGVTTISALAGSDDRSSPRTAAEQGELDAGLERALLGLGSPARELVFCRLVLGMDFAAIAAELALASADSARAQFHKALVRLRERLGPAAGGAG